jgi:hypothetical protein
MSTPQHEVELRRERELASWQRKLLPWLTTIVTVVLAFFLLATAVQLFRLEKRVSTFRPSDLPSLQDPAALFESYSIQRRFHLAGVLLIGRLWVIYLGFVTGMILAIVGAAFILAKLREDQSEFTAKTADASFLFKSSSPGLIMTGLGVILMLTTILTPQTISVREGPLYMSGISIQTSPKAPSDHERKTAESLQGDDVTTTLLNKRRTNSPSRATADGLEVK